VNGFLFVNCRLVVGNNALTVSNAMTVNSTGAFDMASGAAVLINGDATFNGLTSNLTGGTMELKGNLTEAGQAINAFAASGSHLVRFTANAQQTVSFNGSHVDPQGSRFQNVEIVNAGASSLVLFNTPAKALGTVDLNTNAKARVAATNTFFIYAGSAIMRLHAGSTLTLDGTLELELGGTCRRDNTATINGSNSNGIVGGSCTVASLP
jgi:hypothetical protein